MCQMCDEADVYLAQLEAAAKKNGKGGELPQGGAGSRTADEPAGNDVSGGPLKEIAPRARV